MRPQNDTIEQAVRGLKFRAFENINSSEFLRSTSELNRIGCTKSNSSLYAFIKVVGKCFIDKRRYTFRTTGSKLCLAFVSSMTRKDIRILQETILKINIPFDTITEKDEPRWYPFSCINRLWHLISWKQTLGTTHLTHDQQVAVLNTLLSAFTLQEVITKQVSPSNYSLLTVFYDATPLHNLLVQIFKLYGVTTATLQHGVILAPREGASDNSDFSGIELLGSKSDFFLAWNTFTKTEAIKAGIPEQKIKVLGISRCIGQPFHSISSNQKPFGLFGIILDGKLTEQNNPKMIAIANDFALRHGLKYRLRYHPNDNPHKYDAFVNWSVFEGCSDKEETLFQFVSQIDFTILANSTALMELAYKGILVYRYSTQTVYDKYREITSNTFKNIDELTTLVNEKTNDSALFQNLVSIQDPTSAYTNFFKTFL